jgi:hypothetical protein
MSRFVAPVTTESVRELLADDLLRDEKVLWAGQPDPDILFAPADRFLVPFSLLWGGFALFWEISVIVALINGERHSGNGGNLWFFVIMGAPMVLIGLYFMFGRFFYKRLRKRRTFYSVTNKRVLILMTLFGRHLTASFIDTIATVEKSVGARGTASLRFGSSRPVGWWRWWRFGSEYENTGLELLGWSRADTVPAFHDIRDASTVEELINDLRTRQKDGRATR